MVYVQTLPPASANLHLCQPREASSHQLPIVHHAKHALSQPKVIHFQTNPNPDPDPEYTNLPNLDPDASLHPDAADSNSALDEVDKLGQVSRVAVGLGGAASALVMQHYDANDSFLEKQQLHKKVIHSITIMMISITILFGTQHDCDY